MGPREIGPVSAITLMVQNLGGPVVLVVIQAVQTSRTLYLGGTTGPVKDMTIAQLDALGHGYTYSLLWVAGIAHPGRRRRVLDRLLRARHRPRAAHQGSRGGRGTVTDEARPTRQEISDAVGELGWRLILGAIQTHVQVPSLVSAAAVASVAAAAAEADGDGHLDIDLRSTRVVLRLMDSTVGATTGRDLRLARQITEALVGQGFPTTPGIDADIVVAGVGDRDRRTRHPGDQAVLEGRHRLRRRTRPAR